MTQAKTPKTDKAEKVSAEQPAREELQLAAEIHTLAQMIYGRLTQAHPWAVPFPTEVPVDPMVAWPPTVDAGPQWEWPQSAPPTL